MKMTTNHEEEREIMRAALALIAGIPEPENAKACEPEELLSRLRTARDIAARAVRRVDGGRVQQN